MFDQWLKSLSKTTLAALAIGLGIGFILLSDPPHTVCDSQLEVFRKSQAGVLFPPTDQKAIKTSQIERGVTDCKATNAPGGCYRLFLDLRKLLSDLGSVPEECRGSVSDITEVRKAIWNNLDLLIRIAWGAKPPQTYLDKYNWLDPADLSLFCSLKRAAELYYGDSAWVDFRERYFSDLPGSADLPRTQAWELMLLSVNCSQYP